MGGWVYVTERETHLSRVSPEGGGPALGQTTHTLLLDGDLESGDQVLVLGRVHLQAALDQIQGHDHCVGQAAGQGSSQAAQRVILHRAELAGVSLGGIRGSDLSASYQGRQLLRGGLAVHLADGGIAGSFND